MMNKLPFLLTLFLCWNLSAKEYFVAVNGSDQNPGTWAEPFRHIQKAAEVMLPGDTCTVREGVYREWIKPVHGGTSETMRITFRAMPGEKVIIKGSEQITFWQKHTDRVWRIELPDSYFGAFNPFKTNISGGWIKYGKEYHLGDVYMNGKSFKEKFDMDSVYAKSDSYLIEYHPKSVSIYANFTKSDPNAELTEINVRECVLFPEVKGLQYITVDGFTMMHAAANWTCFRAFQHALIGTYWGKNWIIQNCEISDAKCSGIVCGNDPSSEDEGFDVESTGHHIIRNNVIRRCGEAGIHGFKGWACSIIENNLIEEINYKKEYGGFETGGIKLHDAVDVIIRNNIIRKVYVGGIGQYAGIWIDWGAQGTRISGNVVYDMEASALFLQNAHGGPLLVDNNVFSGEIRSSMENCVYVHNLFINCPWNYKAEKFTPVYWKPHTAEVVQTLATSFRNDKIYNNIYIKTGADGIPQHPGFDLNWNVFLDGARKSSFADKNSLCDSSIKSNATIISLDNGVEISYFNTPAISGLKCPLITNKFIGKFELTGQGLEDHQGKPLSVDTDMFGNKRKNQPSAGPYENSTSGKNILKLEAGPNHKIL